MIGSGLFSRRPLKALEVAGLWMERPDPQRESLEMMSPVET